MQGDFDLMMVDEDILCAESSSGTEYVDILKPVYSDDVPPGYARVVAVNLNDISVLGSLCSMSYLYSTLEGLPFISSTVFQNFFKQIDVVCTVLGYDSVDGEQVGNSGPACSRTVKILVRRLGDYRGFRGAIIDTDLVRGIYFYSSIYLPRWVSRLRQLNWPSSDVINEVSSMEWYIVPVGSTEGHSPNLEWRISYVNAEHKLIHSFNSIQFKL